MADKSLDAKNTYDYLMRVLDHGNEEHVGLHAQSESRIICRTRSVLIIWEDSDNGILTCRRIMHSTDGGLIMTWIVRTIIICFMTEKIKPAISGEA